MTAAIALSYLLLSIVRSWKLIRKCWSLNVSGCFTNHLLVSVLSNLLLVSTSRFNDSLGLYGIKKLIRTKNGLMGSWAPESKLLHRIKTLWRNPLFHCTDWFLFRHWKEVEIEKLHLSIDHKSFMLELFHFLFDFIHITFFYFLKIKLENVHLQLQKIVFIVQFLVIVADIFGTGVFLFVYPAL